MINQNDFRIGNYFLGGDPEEIICVESSNSFSDADRCTPILLTFDTIKRCGFSESEQRVYRLSILSDFHGHFVWHEGHQEYIRYIHGAGGHYEISFPHIVSLHLLQNLYRDFTGEDLKVNLDALILGTK